MIGRLLGKIKEIGIDYIIIDVNGVGYIVFCSSKLIGKYNINDEVELITQTIVKENDISIFGFATNTDKEFFNHLLTIQGVGAKLAQTIIGSLDVNEIIQSVQTNDNAKFTKISGVGAKLAARLVSELKNKRFISKLQNIKLKTSINKEDPLNSQKILDATSALINLGYSNTQINQVIQDILVTNKTASLEEIIKLSIKALSNAKYSAVNKVISE